MVGKRKDETAGVAIDLLKPKIYSYLEGDNNEHKKVRSKKN